MERYVLRGGRWGYDRLRILAQVRRADTLALLGRAGVGPGQRCVDLGSGSGEVSFELARLTGPDGSVTGIDMDEVKLALAREAAAERGLANVEFRVANVNDWAEPGAYDLVYSRFLLQHLSRPGDLLRRMWEAVRPGGVIAVEGAVADCVAGRGVEGRSRRRAGWGRAWCRALVRVAVLLLPGRLPACSRGCRGPAGRRGRAGFRVQFS